MTRVKTERRDTRWTCGIAIAGVAALSGWMNGACAQSSVTLSGIVDGGLNYSSDVRSLVTPGGLEHPAIYRGGKLYAFESGTWNASRWRLSGQEDLGSGRKALFYFESGFNLGTGAMGQAGTLFNRQSYMGLADASLGSLTFGRQYDAVVDMVGSIGPTSFLTGMAARAGDIDNIDNNARINNSVKYTSVSYNGLQFAGVYGFGGQPGSLAAMTAWSFGLTYRNGPWNAGVAYLHANSRPTAQGTWDGAYTGFFSSSISEGFASATSLNEVAATLNYRYRSTTFGITFSNTRLCGGEASLYTGCGVFNTIQGTVNWQATSTLRMAGGYAFTHRASMGETGSAQYHQINLSTYYSLTRRTALYALGGYQLASGHTLDPYGNTVAATASLGDVSNGASAAGSRQAVVRVGVRHLF